METVPTEEACDNESTQRYTSAQQTLNAPQVKPVRSQLRECSDVELISLIAIRISAVVLFIVVVLLMLSQNFANYLLWYNANVN